MTQKNSRQTDALFLPAQLPTSTRHVDMLETAINEARAQGYLDRLDDGLVSLALASATALDQAETDRKYYAIAQLSGPYLEVLTALKLVPSARETENNDELSRALRELSNPAICDAETDR